MKPAFTSHINFARRTKKRSLAGMIPLIDIAFFLLIFFMVAGTIEQFEIIDVNPPEAQSGKMLDEGHATILLGRYDEIVMDDLLLSPEELSIRLKTAFTMHPGKVITIKADATVRAVKIIDIMDRVQIAGGKQVTIATEGAE